MKARRLNPAVHKAVFAAAILTAAPFAIATEPISQAEQNVLDAVWGALNAQPELADTHRGFLRYLFEHPEFAAALEAVRPLQRHPVVRELTVEFDNALASNAEFERGFKNFYAALAKNDRMREAVDALYRIELNLAPPSLQQAVVLLKADIDAALDFLANPARPAIQGLHPFKAAFKQDPTLRQRLLEQFSMLHKMPDAHETVFMWWRMVLAEQNDAGAAYVRLLGELARRPDRFWAWHGAHAEFAKHPNARLWTAFWERRVGGDDVLRASYDTYIDIVSRRPEYARAAFDAWQDRLGPAPQWPPDTEPPKPHPAPSQGVPHRASLPEVTKPQAQMPTMPDMPAKPEKPPMPEPARPNMHRVQPD